MNLTDLTIQKLRPKDRTYAVAEITRAITWEAPEHNHIEKTSDWYWALGIIAVATPGASLCR